jgi:hypothetical protein
MAETTVIKTKCDGTIVLSDGTSPTPLSYTVALEAGDLSVTPMRFTFTDLFDRCEIVGSRKSGVEPGSIAFSVHMRQFTGGTDGSIIDFIEGTGAYSARVSTDAGEFEGNVLQVALTVSGTSLGDSADHVMTFPKCRLFWEFAEGEPNTINITGTVLAAPTITGPS